MSIVEGTSVLLADGRYPYDGDADTVVWPITMELLKKHSQIGHTLEDELLSSDFGGYLADAVEYVESRGQVSLINQRRRIVLDRLPCDETIYAIRGPLVSVERIQYLDANDTVQTLSTDYYRADTRSKRGGVYFKDNSFETADGEAVAWVDMTCGFGTEPKDVPAQWRQLVAIVATHSYERRELASGGGLDDAMESVVNRKIIAAGASRRYV